MECLIFWLSPHSILPKKIFRVCFVIKIPQASDNRILLPASLSLGGSFLLLIDNISRAVIAIEIPIGILTAIIGVPIFLYLLKRGYSEWS